MIDLLVDDLLVRALREDLGRTGDITTDAIVPAEARGRAMAVARSTGVVSGIGVFARTFALLDARVSTIALVADGAAVARGVAIAEVSGPLRAILAAERTALNLLSHLSGVATATRRLVDLAAGTRAAIIDTRKTNPGLRALEKAAVRDGGGRNHRFGLDDAILIKDNHVAAAGGVAAALGRAKAVKGHLTPVEVEVDSLDQLAEAIPFHPDVIMLDNFTLDDLRRAVALTRAGAGASIRLEASGGVSLQTVRAIAETGVDAISVGALTHSAPALDIGLDAE
jgi:nicotinate-nucleotide pyrophosphorylase (carboxylating)